MLCNLFKAPTEMKSKRKHKGKRAKGQTGESAQLTIYNFLQMDLEFKLCERERETGNPRASARPSPCVQVQHTCACGAGDRRHFVIGGAHLLSTK